MRAKHARLWSSRLLPLFDDFSADESIKKMEFAIEIRVAFLEQLSLLSRTHAAARGFAVARVELVDYAHAFYDPAKWREAHRVEARLIARVDVNLRRTSVWAGHSKRERPSHVAVLHRIVGEPFVLPNLRNHGIARNAELRESAGNHAEEPRIIVEAHLDEMVEAIGAAWRERPSNVEHDDAPCGFNAHAVHTRRRLRPQRVVRIMQRARALLGYDRLQSRGRQHARVLVLRVMGWRSRCKQRRKRNESRQKDESSHIQTHARGSLPMTVSARERRAMLSQWGPPMRRSNAKRRLVSRQDSKVQQRITGHPEVIPKFVARAGFAAASRAYEPLVLSYATTAPKNYSNKRMVRVAGVYPK